MFIKKTKYVLASIFIITVGLVIVKSHFPGYSLISVKNRSSGLQDCSGLR